MYIWEKNEPRSLPARRFLKMSGPVYTVKPPNDSNIFPCIEDITTLPRKAVLYFIMFSFICLTVDNLCDRDR